MSGELLRTVYEEASNGNPQPLIDSLADDIVWTIIGSTKLSGTYRGKAEVLERLLGRLRASLSTPIRFEIERTITEGQYAVLLANGYATAVTGKPYNNRYCIVSRVVDGKIAEMTDYIDTELITTALFDGQASDDRSD